MYTIHNVYIEFEDFFFYQIRFPFKFKSFKHGVIE